MPLLDSFGNAKTLINPNASRHSPYLELYFNECGRIQGAKVLAYGLDKTHHNHLTFEERTYNVFYQFLAGATPEERDRYNLEDPSDYALLASLGCYRLPSGPFSDDSIAMADLCVAVKTLGFKPKHTASIFSLLVAILLLGNLQFSEADACDVSAYVSNVPVLEHVASLLGVGSEKLSEVLMNKTSYGWKELYTVMLNAHRSAAQCDQLARDLYAILFAFVTETANHKIAPAGIVGTSPVPHPPPPVFTPAQLSSRTHAGVTTNSEGGIESYEAYYPMFAAMEAVGFVLNLHSEVPSAPAANMCVLDVEPTFLPHLRILHATFPRLRIVLKHAMTCAAVECVKSFGNTVVCTITVHHPALTVDDWAGQTWNFCKPVGCS
ncbi:Dihydroorotase [Grifola frondosa]|uniref:Dihydroorotase n=1 Tax=Grifola frondosa TaxID=5627 RepID=A0A1C7MNM5_GRIFR|nr:Dihydroorotase [Grifola frondosa]